MIGNGEVIPIGTANGEAIGEWQVDRERRTAKSAAKSEVIGTANGEMIGEQRTAKANSEVIGMANWESATSPAWASGANYYQASIPAAEPSGVLQR